MSHSLVDRLRRLDGALEARRLGEANDAIESRRNGLQSWALQEEELQRAQAAAKRLSGVLDGVLALKADVVYKMQRRSDGSCVQVDPAAQEAFARLVQTLGAEASAASTQLLCEAAGRADPMDVGALERELAALAVEALDLQTQVAHAKAGRVAVDARPRPRAAPSGFWRLAQDPVLARALQL